MANISAGGAAGLEFCDTSLRPNRAMQNRSIGQSGIQASVVALGGAPISGWPWGESDERQAVAAITSAWSKHHLIDTAPVYGIAGPKN